MQGRDPLSLNTWDLDHAHFPSILSVLNFEQTDSNASAPQAQIHWGRKSLSLSFSTQKKKILKFWILRLALTYLTRKGVVVVRTGGGE